MRLTRVASFSCELVLLLPLLAGCLATPGIRLVDGMRLENVTALTTRSGTEIEFRSPGARVANDTLYAEGPNDRVAIPTDSIAQIRERKSSSVVVPILIGIAALGGLIVIIGIVVGLSRVLH
jgi:hypothetical protein